jgi:hypothetical protein
LRHVSENRTRQQRRTGSGATHGDTRAKQLRQNARHLARLAGAGARERLVTLATLRFLRLQLALDAPVELRGPVAAERIGRVLGEHARRRRAELYEAVPGVDEGLPHAGPEVPTIGAGAARLRKLGRTALQIGVVLGDRLRLRCDLRELELAARDLGELRHQRTSSTSGSCGSPPVTR